MCWWPAHPVAIYTTNAIESVNMGLSAEADQEWGFVPQR